MSLLITDAGIAASVQAGELGISYKITHVSIGSEGYIPTSDQIALRNEIQRKAITRADLIDVGQLHFETVWDGAEEFEGRELGYWLEDGTLFAVDSRDGQVITYKRKDSVITEACELNLSGSSIENITVELLGSPYATEEVAGIAKIATNEQVDIGSDDSAFLTVKKLVYALGVPHIINKLVSNLWLKMAARICPVGVPLPWPTDTAPEGFAIMKGQAFDLATYTELAKAYPNGIIEDMRGLAVVGKEENELILAYEADQVKSHSHSGSVQSTNIGTKTSSSNGLHNHNFASHNRGTGTAQQGIRTTHYMGDINNGLIRSAGNHNHTVAIGSHAHALIINAFGAVKNTIRNRKFNWIVRMA